MYFSVGRSARRTERRNVMKRGKLIVTVIISAVAVIIAAAGCSALVRQLRELYDHNKMQIRKPNERPAL